MKAIQRVKQYIDKQGFNNSSFEKKNKLSNGYIGTQIKRNADLGEGVLNKILDNCLDLNPEWLLTGKGEMLRSNTITIQNQNRVTKDARVEVQQIPLYDLEATAGLVELFSSGKPAEQLDTIQIPNIPKCDGAISVTGDSMYPLLKSGDIILYKEVPKDINNIFFGEMYLLGVNIDNTEEMVTVKFVQKSDKGDHYVKLVSQNQHHQPKDIHLNNITAIAMVKVSIRVNTMF